MPASNPCFLPSCYTYHESYVLLLFERAWSLFCLYDRPTRATVDSVRVGRVGRVAQSVWSLQFPKGSSNLMDVILYLVTFKILRGGRDSCSLLT